MSKYPLIEKVLGREPVPKAPTGGYYVFADDLERALEKGVRVSARKYDNEVFGEWYDKPQDDDTHTALLIGITPIERDTAESVLREIVEKLELPTGSYLYRGDAHEIVERAKKVLGKE